MCNHDTSEIEHGVSACTVGSPLIKAPGLYLRTGGQTLLYLSHKLFVLSQVNNDIGKSA